MTTENLNIFIGGTHDGERIEIPESETSVRLPVKTPAACPLETELYKQLFLKGQNTVRFRVFIIPEIEPDDLLRRLLLRYHTNTFLEKEVITGK